MCALTLTSFDTTTFVVAWTVSWETRFFMVSLLEIVRVLSERPKLYISLGKVSVRKEKQASDRGRYLYSFSNNVSLTMNDSAKVRIFP